MKKILFVIMLIASSIFSFAGIIVTTSGERIEDVTIVSETDSAIVYIQDGVEKSIAIEQVQAVLFDNGNYKEYPKYTSPVTTNEFMTSSEQTNLYVQHLNVKGHRDNQSTGVPLDGKKLWLSGLITGGCGLGITIIGAILCGVSADDRYVYDPYNSLNNGYTTGESGTYIVGALFTSLGCVATAASVPLLTIGGIRKFKKTDKSTETAEAYILELQVQKNQLGFALKF